MPTMNPATPDELAATLGEAGRAGKSVALQGNGSKVKLAGPILPADVEISTTSLSRVLQYEAPDLTISVESGCSFARLQAILAEHGQMIGLDPPFALDATIGGIVASDGSGPLRQAFGTARDQVIGMTFALMDGTLVSSGGMVVKNVAGLDMAKLLIGSFGTLAVITSINFRLYPRPEQTLTFLHAAPDIAAILSFRQQVVQSALRPLAFDLLSPAASARLGRRGWLLALRAAGSTQVLRRYGHELEGWDTLQGAEDRNVWRAIREWTPEFLKRHPAGAVLRVHAPLANLPALLHLVSVPCIVRAGIGTAYVYVASAASVPLILKTIAGHEWPYVVECAPPELRSSVDLWPLNGAPARQNAFAMMERVKQLFDPGYLLNKSRLYGRL